MIREINRILTEFRSALNGFLFSVYLKGIQAEWDLMVQKAKTLKEILND